MDHSGDPNSTSVARPIPLADPSAMRRVALPESAKKATDLEALKKAVDDGAFVGGGLWLSYLLALFYLMVAAVSVTHADLFLERPINLLFLNVQLPIVAFFALAPLLFLGLHAYTLVHLVMLTEKVRRFRSALDEQFRETIDMALELRLECKRIRDALCAQLPSNVFVQLLAGPPEIRGGVFGGALRAIAWTTLAFGPIVLLLTYQLQFLPYHYSLVTWTHRIVLSVDLGLIWWLWRRHIVAGQMNDEARRIIACRVWSGIWAISSIAIVIFAFVLATFRGETLPEPIAPMTLPAKTVSQGI